MPEQRALAATTAAHDNQRIATMDIERDVVEHRAIPKFSNKAFTSMIVSPLAFGSLVHAQKRKCLSEPRS